MNIKEAAIREKAIRLLEARHKDKHDSLFLYMKEMYAKELKKEYND
jgi:hypothetical protein